uniref:Putative ovule protein n=1 Tax=Solanum chacoense TaxID=4108 RepID=A0A0V0HRJ9_SOLCH
MLYGVVECCRISLLASAWACFVSKIADFLLCSTRNSSKFTWVPMLSLPVGFQFISPFGSFRLFIPVLL